MAVCRQTVGKTEGIFTVSSKNILLRATSSSDADFLWRVFRDTMHDYITSSRGYWSEENELAEFHEQTDMAGTNLIYVGESGAPVGFVTKHLEEEALVLQTLCVDVEHQRQGIGRAVMEALQAEATKAGVKMRLSVLKTNPGAKRLYEAMGFKNTVETAHHYHMVWG
jgi:ribosomal protein S18 acetylase RimI-like enzyme